MGASVKLRLAALAAVCNTESVWVPHALRRMSVPGRERLHEVRLRHVPAVDSKESASASDLNSSLPRKRSPEVRENFAREIGGVRIADSSCRPGDETLMDRPNLGEFGKAGFPELDPFNQGLDFATESMTIKLSDDERRSVFGVSGFRRAILSAEARPLAVCRQELVEMAAPAGRVELVEIDEAALLGRVQNRLDAPS
jgi:hypothetical protein